MTLKKTCAAAAALMLSACTATSFAPPRVGLPVDGSGGTACTPHNVGAIGQNVQGALHLVDNYVYAYRCSARAAANGRQIFEIPSFLALVGTTAAVAFGAGENVAIAGGFANATLGAGNRYYAPEEQAEILDHAVDALLCIQMETVGVEAYNIPRATQEQELAARAGGTVEIPFDQQYYRMVAAALLSVERVAAQRLSRRGTFDPAGVLAEMERLTNEIRGNQGGETGGAGGAGGTGGEGGAPSNFMGQAGTTATGAQIQIDQLKPKLERCVLRAKV